jgi:uncharacterized protein HemY
MTTTDTVLLIVLTSLLSIFIILCIAVVVVLLKLLSSVKRVVGKAEDVVPWNQPPKCSKMPRAAWLFSSSSKILLSW